MKRYISLALVLVMTFSMLVLLPETKASALGSFDMNYLYGLDYYLDYGENYVGDASTLYLDSSESSSNDYYTVNTKGRRFEVNVEENQTAYVELNDCVIWNVDNFTDIGAGGWFQSWRSCIVVEQGATLYLKITGNNCLLAGDNNPAIEVKEGGGLIILGDGNLSCLGGEGGGPGIGEEPGETAGSIIVSSAFTGKLFAVGQGGGAGIGSGEGGSISYIEIGGGNVYAFGGKSLFNGSSPNYLKAGTGAGIGTGKSSNLVSGQGILISNNAHVEAYGGDGGAGIGTGQGGYITGGIGIEDNPFVYAAGCLGGAGIGTGAGGRMAVGGIFINCGSTSNIQAIGSLGGAGIGTGQSALTIDFATCDINILGGNIYAQGGSDAGSGGPGIGFGAGGGQPNCFMLFGNSKITALGGNGAAGIGGGSDVMAPQGPTAGIRGAITIMSGTIYAAGQSGGAGIGGGVYQMGGFVEIWSGMVYASGGSIDIGGGNPYDRGVLFLDHSTYTPGQYPPLLFLAHGTYPSAISTGATVIQNSATITANTNVAANTIFGTALPGGLNAVANAPALAMASIRTVTFDSNGGSSVTPISVAAGVALSTEPTPTKDNINFAGWYTDNSTFANRANFPYVPPTPITLYAKWDFVPVIGVAITSNAETLVLGDGNPANDTVDLYAGVGPSDASDPLIIWSSSDSSVATVDQDGLVTAIKAGTATIYATAHDTTIDTYSAQCVVTVQQAVTGVTISSDAATLILDDGNPSNDTVDLDATIIPNDASDPAITWSSSDTSVATVDQEGLVTAIKAGTATISVTVHDTTNGTISDACVVTVQQAVTGVTISSAAEALILDDGNPTNDTVDLDVTLIPNDASDAAVTWSSSDTSVATVDSDGVVTAVMAGTAMITVTAHDATNGTLSDTCVITVRQAVTGVTISSALETLILDDGDMTNDTVDLDVTMIPSDATDDAVTWLSSDSSVATVDSDGVVIAVMAGTTTITVTAHDTTNGTLSDTCSLTVLQAVTGMTISSAAETLILDDGNLTRDTVDLDATLMPIDVSDTAVIWSSSDTSVATVDTDGVVTAIKAGTATITVTAHDTTNGTLSDTCEITVRQAVTGVTISTDFVPLMLDDDPSYEWADLHATVLPGDASDKGVTWSSDNTSIATVDELTGHVTAIKAGNATITVTTDDQRFSASCVVSVLQVPTGVYLSASAKTLVLGDSDKSNDALLLTATTTPSDAAFVYVLWTSDNPSVAMVNEHTGAVTASVTALKAGRATITARNGQYTASCVITVRQTVTGIVISSSAETLVMGDNITTNDTVDLNASVLPSDATVTDISWSSSDTNVATVDQNGKVAAVGKGDATITATANGKSATCLVSVTAVSPTPAPTAAPTNPSETTGQTVTINPTNIVQDQATGRYLMSISVSDLPDGSSSIRMPNGDLVEIAGQDKVQIEMAASDLNADGSLLVVALDDEGIPLASFQINVPVTTTNDDIWPVIMWILIGLVGVSLVTVVIFTIFRRRKTA